MLKHLFDTYFMNLGQIISKLSLLPFIIPIYPLLFPISGTNTSVVLEDFLYVFLCASTINAEIVSFLRVRSRSLCFLD